MILTEKNGLTLVFEENGCTKTVTYPDTADDLEFIAALVIGEDYDVITERKKVKEKTKKVNKIETFVEVEGGWRKAVPTKDGLYVTGYLYTWLPKECYVIGKGQDVGTIN